MAQPFEHDQIIGAQAVPTRSFRYSTNLAVLAALVNHGKEKKLPNTVLRNVSCNGVGIFSQVSLTIGEVISLQFYLPETGLPFRALCSVVWSNSQGHCGLRFQQVSDQHLRRLRTWLNSKSAEHQPS